MTIPHDEQVRILEMRVRDLERQVWMSELDIESERAASNASGAANAGERTDNMLANLQETKARLNFFTQKLEEVKSSGS